MKIVKKMVNAEYHFDEETEKKLFEAGFVRNDGDCFYHQLEEHITIGLSDDGYEVDFSMWHCKTKEDLKAKYERAMEKFDELEKILGVNGNE